MTRSLNPDSAEGHPFGQAGPIAAGRIADGDLPATIEAILRQAAARIDAWTPKGVHFGWERAFKNKGKFPAWMSKAEARQLVQRLLREAPVTVFTNRREGRTATDEWRIVVATGEVIGTRGQRILRVVIVRDAVGYLVDNAFPVLHA